MFEFQFSPRSRQITYVWSLQHCLKVYVFSVFGALKHRKKETLSILILPDSLLELLYSFLLVPG